jgi:hypothetical protein
MSHFGNNQLRQQNVQVLFFDDSFEVASTHNVTINAAKETIVKDLEGVITPRAYLLNYMDW